MRGRVTSQPEWIEPMHATLTDERFSDPDWIFERGRTSFTREVVRERPADGGGGRG